MRFFLLLCALPLLAQIDQPTDITGWLYAKAQALLAERRAKIAAIKTPAQARERQAWVRAKLLELLTGLPDYKGPLNPRTTGTIDHGNYRIEKVIFDSLPRFPVTANLYLPKTTGRHPAVLFSMGHWNEGKPVAQLIAGNLSLQGFVVLVYDPIGQGERLQGYDPVTRAARAGGSVEQHFMAGAEAILAGDNFARYMVWDSKRAIDYLQSRPEVDPEKIGATGCSGGGTQTTFISALDPRIKVAAPACYLQTFALAYTAPNTLGDSEQSWPGFLAAGLDETDFVEAFAPKPYLIANTDGDYFTPSSAKLVYEEARDFYKILGAEDRLTWVVGPGPHGTPLKVREAIYGWFIRWLNNGQGSAKEEAVKLHSDHALWATKTGQVATELKARGIESIIRENWERQQTTTATQSPKPVTDRRDTPRTRTMRQSSSGNIAIEHLLVETEPGLEVAATLYVPTGNAPAGNTKKTGVLMVEPAPRALDVARQGHVVLTLAPRGTPAPPAGTWNRYFGDWAAATRSWLVGLSLPEMRAFDIHRAITLLASRSDVGQVRATASGIAGLWLLRGALGHEQTVTKLWLDRTPVNECAAIGLSLHYDLHEAAHPGHCTDWASTVSANTKILWSDPTDWMRHIEPHRGARYYYRHFEEGESALWNQFLRP